MKPARKPKLAVWKFSSCDGCQLSILDCEDELLALAGAVDIAYFPEATRTFTRGPYDLSLVEGSITTPEEAHRIHGIRRASKALIAIGACAVSGGIQALRNFHDVREFASLVYARPESIEVLSQSTPVSQHVRVDLELRGCPVDRVQLLEILNAFLNRRPPVLPDHSLCLECKAKGISCVLVQEGLPCLGPVTYGGCGALCPASRRGCYGCFGPRESANTAAMSAVWIRLGTGRRDLVRGYRTVNAGAPAFRKESEAHERD